MDLYRCLLAAKLVGLPCSDPKALGLGIATSLRMQERIMLHGFVRAPTDTRGLAGYRPKHGLCKRPSVCPDPVCHAQRDCHIALGGGEEMIAMSHPRFGGSR